MAFAAALVEFTNKDEREHPMLMKLLEKLRTEITVDGISVDVHMELVEARREAEEATRKFNEALVLKEACNNIMVQQYKVEGGKSLKEREAFEQELHNWYDRMRVQECASLGIPGLPVLEMPPVNEEFVKRTIIPLIEADLQRQSQAIIDCLDTPCSVDEADHVVRYMAEEMESLKQELHILRLDHARKLLSFKQVLEDYLEMKIESPEASADVASTATEAECLENRVLCSTTKLRLMTEEMHADTYSQEKVEALKHIRQQLQKEVTVCKKDIKEMSENLEKFKELSPRIKAKIEEYGNMKMEVNRLEAALAVYKV